MNSADKIEEGSDPPLDGLAVPAGGYLGMERTVVKKDGVSTWFESDAYHDEPLGQGQFVPLDEEMGTGHLNASRAFTQFSAGEQNHEAGDVPLIGWDYGTTTGAGDNNRYRFEEPLLAGSFVSITIAWDRDVDLDMDAGTIGEFDTGDSFEDYTQETFEPEADSVINDLDLRFMPKFSDETGDAEASSVAKSGTVDHIFFQVPTTGPWEFWVEQWDQETEVGVGQDYAVAWWAMSAADPTLSSDFNGDGMVDGADLAQWRGDFGPTDDGSDADGDGDSDGADFLTWQRELGMTSATPVSAAVPEPSAWLLSLVGLPFLLCRRAAA